MAAFEPGDTIVIDADADGSVSIDRGAPPAPSRKKQAVTAA